MRDLHFAYIFCAAKFKVAKADNFSRNGMFCPSEAMQTLNVAVKEGWSSSDKRAFSYSNAGPKVDH